MHSFQKIIIITVCFIAFNACSKNTFEQVVVVNLPKPEPALVPALSLNNYFSPILSLTLTQDPLVQNNSNGYLSIPNANVEILEDGVSKGLMQLTTNTNSSTYQMVTPFIPQAGKEYSLKISHPNYPNVSATDVMPSLVPINVENTGKFKYVRSPFNGQQVDTFMEVRMTFTDPVTNGDYYKLLITDSLAADSLGNSHWSFNINNVISNDVIFSKYQNVNEGPINIGSNGNKYLDLNNNFFNDEFINGKTTAVLIYLAKGFDFGGGQFYGGFRKPYFYLQHHSLPSYKFNSSVINYNQNSGNPFSQPVILYSNVVGGFGILGCNTVSVDTLQF